MRILLASDGLEYTSEQQLAPIFRHAAPLRDHLGVIIRHSNVTDVLALESSTLAKFHLVGVKLSFRVASLEAERHVRALRQKLANTSSRLVYFDGDDDANVQWPRLLEHVDLYVKKHVFASRRDYTRSYIGKSNLTDYAAQTFGVSFADDIIPTSGKTNWDDVPKIALGWNIALDDKIVELSKSLPAAAGPVRVIDVTCRAHLPPTIWSHGLRAQAVDRLEAMSARFRVASPKTRVPQAQYYEEMLSSKICVSPFGFGEICWRDFEAVVCGCLLVKPDMSHLQTAPDLFVPGVTYAPVRWDYADLEGVCARYLANDEDRLRITREARGRLMAALRRDWFVERFRGLLGQLGLAEPAMASSCQ